MRKILDILQHALEYGLIVVWALAGLSEVIYPETLPEGALAFLASSTVGYVYAVLFIGMAMMLLYSKWFRKPKTHKHALMAMYLTTIYTIVLAVAIFGIGAAYIGDDVVIGAVAAFCWLRWKFKTEYLTRDQFYSKRLPIRTDP